MRAITSIDRLIEVKNITIGIFCIGDLSMKNTYKESMQQ